MKSRVYSPMVFCLLLLACHSADQQKATEETKPMEPKNYFPVLDYLKSEVAYVDSFPLRIMRYTVNGPHKDSAIIRTSGFDSLARAFLLPGLAKEELEKGYTEKSFLDQTSESLTFTYSPETGGHSIKRVDVLAAPDPGFDKVKSIYIEMDGMQGDTPVLKKMFWSARKNFQIVTILHPPGQPEMTRQLKVVWDSSRP